MDASVKCLRLTNENAQNGLGEFCSLSPCVYFCGNVLKEMAHALVEHLPSYGCTWEVGGALEKLEKQLNASLVLSQLPACIHLRNGAWMHAGSWESTIEAFEWREAKPGVLP